MMWRNIARAGAWLLLFSITLLQLAASIVSEQFLPLKADQYRLQYADADANAPGVERLKDVQVFVRYDVWTPFPIMWTSSVSFVAVLVLGVTGMRERQPPTASPV